MFSGMISVQLLICSGSFLVEFSRNIATLHNYKQRRSKPMPRPLSPGEEMAVTRVSMKCTCVGPTCSSSVCPWRRYCCNIHLPSNALTGWWRWDVERRIGLVEYYSLQAATDTQTIESYIICRCLLSSLFVLATAILSIVVRRDFIDVFAICVQPLQYGGLICLTRYTPAWTPV